MRLTDRESVSIIVAKELCYILTCKMSVYVWVKLEDLGDIKVAVIYINGARTDLFWDLSNSIIGEYKFYGEEFEDGINNTIIRLRQEICY